MSTSKIQMFRYQPELAGTVIYWSLTGVVLFLSIIGLLEHQGAINLFSIVTFIIFLIIGYLGTRRKMILTGNQLKVYAILPKNCYQIDISEISEISIGKMGVTIIVDNQIYTYIMLPPSKKSFVKTINQQVMFNGKLYGQI
ncbi:hypothetical protein CBF34_02550 [Vagococcus penaei]|uniref:Uncharacterized protein n=1 Tax=Vagococcus penaei TaxID=633807 RepID=A0A1Q2D436_9ENTE|nr:EbsA family protein [Vagococcus penaei]AQP53128.1 hypothetical protein BW732_02040 [Vagococcus penaei]RSU06010.1 hypothetical protein CBF34_02550 [Vagococcus penaei]